MERITSVIYTGSYAVLLGAFLVLAVLSRREEPVPYARDPPLLRPFRRMAAYVYRRMQEYRAKRRRAGRDVLIPGEESVRSDLQILYPSLKARRQETIYHLEKIEKLLLLFFAGTVLAGGLHVRSLCSGILQDGRTVQRSPVGGGDQVLQVTAGPPQQTREQKEAAETQQKDYGTYTVTVRARQYTYAEAQKQAQEILDRFPAGLLGANPAPDRIREPLRMPEAGETAPFRLSWESSRYAVLDTDGSIFNSEYAEDRAEEVDLTAILTYADYQFQKKMTFVVRAPARDEAEQLQGEILSGLLAAEKESLTSQTFRLPSSAGDLDLAWREQVEDVSAGVLILGAVACILAWYVLDYHLHERTKERSRQLAIDYPQLTSKFVLYLGAGMSVRNVFYKCGQEYMEKTAEGPGKRPRRTKRPDRKNGRRYLYEEILLVCNELDSGIPEAEAYMHFGRRCHLRQYTKLCTLLVQNLRRGNDTLLQVLQEEAQSSFEERKNLARELGEEAGTKLLLPMMIMLAVTMLIIIVPAYFSFSI